MNNTPKYPKRPQVQPSPKSANAGENAIERRLIPRPFPTPEVTEGNDISDWALWEEALANQGGSKPSTAEQPKEETAPDPFESVRKLRGSQ